MSITSLKILYRSLSRNRVFSVISIGGFSISLAVVLLLLSFIRRRRLVLLDDVTVSVLVERELGDLTNSTWIRLIPRFLLKTFVRIADRNLTMAKRYGKVAVTAVGMFSKTATWFIPHGTATILLTVGSISKKPVWLNDRVEPREILHITTSFDHEIVDGAPAARFLRQFSELVEQGTLLNGGEVKG